MDSFQQFPSLCCEIQILRAKNIDYKSTGQLFVRSYISAGNNSKIRINSKEISPNSDLIWNNSTSLDCSGSLDSVDKLMQGNVVFELRWRNTVSILGRIGGSQLLGRAEVPWKSVFESPNMELEKWVVMVSKSRRRVHDEDAKPPMVQISMKIRAPVVPKTAERRRTRSAKWNECGCEDGVCKSCADYDIFAIGAALEGF
ncbi:hypothetical protein LguiA_003212 [Lonicera macranthoides]